MKPVIDDVTSYIVQNYLRINSFDINEYQPGHSVDCAIFGYQDQELKILLMKMNFGEFYTLPGGFIKIDEHIDAAAQRVLYDRTGLKDLFLEQFYTFGAKERPTLWDIKNEKGEPLFQQVSEVNSKFAKWLENRFITTGYFAFVDIEKAELTPDMTSDSCHWVNVDHLPELLLDHSFIVQKCLEQIRIQLNYLPISKSLLPEAFTMQDVQKLYEAILGIKLVRSNFQRKFLKLDILIRLEKKMTGASNKAPYLYMFDEEKYNALLQKGIGLF
ncbi:MULTISPECIES: NUDIX hydrolase [unclassified Maribacter]|uniref:NUDIX hydrolase n=1 Tax=unclassified Maribacter TaxID=2615042 RepID=UPI002579B722|nr:MULTISPECIES: NUDIX domain-containing protein [unclassified Maribacter]|tara:strand:+ start:3920 stop:4735 length:816 start_codon:yes stop_codon:yes gene_type:complete